MLIKDVDFLTSVIKFINFCAENRKENAIKLGTKLPYPIQYIVHSEKKNVLAFWRDQWKGTQEQSFLLLFAYNEDGNISYANFCGVGQTEEEPEVRWMRRGNGKKMDVDLYIVGKRVVPCVGIFGLSARNKGVYRIGLMNVQVLKHSGTNFLFLGQNSAVRSSIMLVTCF